MATITTSVLVESVADGSRKRNRYRYTLDNGAVHERISWIDGNVDNTTDRNARGAAMLDELVAAEIAELLS